MKREDALKKIQEYLDINAGQIVPEQFLNFAEGTLGMKPPCLPEEDCQAIMSVYYAGYTFNQWEEDAAKDEKVQDMKRRKAEAKAAREAKREKR